MDIVGKIKASEQQIDEDNVKKKRAVESKKWSTNEGEDERK